MGEVNTASNRARIRSPPKRVNSSGLVEECCKLRGARRWCRAASRSHAIPFGETSVVTCEAWVFVGETVPTWEDSRRDSVRDLQIDQRFPGQPSRPSTAFTRLHGWVDEHLFAGGLLVVTSRYLWVDHVEQADFAGVGAMENAVAFLDAVRAHFDHAVNADGLEMRC